MIKNYFRILKKPHAYLQTILNTSVKFQKDRTETVGGVKGTKYLLKTRNHAPRNTRHVPRPTENQKQCPSTFLRKGGGQIIGLIFDEKKKYIYIKMSSAAVTIDTLKAKKSFTVELKLCWFLNYPKSSDTASPNHIYGKCPKIQYTNISDKKSYANSADPYQSSLIIVYKVCHYTTNFKEQCLKSKIKAKLDMCP